MDTERVFVFDFVLLGNGLHLRVVDKRSAKHYYFQVFPRDGGFWVNISFRRKLSGQGTLDVDQVYQELARFLRDIDRIPY